MNRLRMLASVGYEEIMCGSCNMYEAKYDTVYGFLCPECLRMLRQSFERMPDAYRKIISTMYVIKADKLKEMSFEELFGVREIRDAEHRKPRKSGSNENTDEAGGRKDDVCEDTSGESNEG